MKPLPENPKPYLRPKERWFENHKHAIDDDGKPSTGTIAVSKTLNAMWLMLHDRTRNPLPKKPYHVSISDRESLIKMLNREPDFMQYWGDKCNNVFNTKDLSLAWVMLLNQNKGGHYAH